MYESFFFIVASLSILMPLFQIQSLTDNYVEQVDELLQKKSKELLQR